MSSSLIIALEFAVVLGVVVGLAVWELWRLRRDRMREVDKTRTTPARDPT